MPAVSLNDGLQIFYYLCKRKKNHPAVQCNRSNIIFKQQLMAQSQDSFNKKEKEKKRLKKRQDKQAKREERKANAGSGPDSMIAYVDEFGNLTDTPPDPTKKVKVSLDEIEISVRKKTEEDMPAVRSGKVDFYNDSKGFGFIIEQDTREKYFVHVSGLKQPIKEGDLVTFELQRGAKGMNAINVMTV